MAEPTTHTLHYTSADEPGDNATWSVYREQYATANAAEPIDGSQEYVSNHANEADANAEANRLQAATARTAATDADDPVYYEVVPLLFGPDYRRPDAGQAADYWTVYSRDADGLARACADVRTSADGLAWLALTVIDPVPVDVHDGRHGPTRTYVGRHFLAGDPDARSALEYNVGAWDEPAERFGPTLPTWAADAAHKGAKRAADVVDGLALNMDTDDEMVTPDEELAYAAGVRDALVWLTTGAADERIRYVLDDPNE